MTNITDIADLVRINHLLSNCIDELVINKSDTDNSFNFFLEVGAKQLHKNENDLIKLLEDIEWDEINHTNLLIQEWEQNVIREQTLVEFTENVKFEIWVASAIEAYKTALNATLLINTIDRFILMDQKCFLQRFLNDLIKHREMNSSVAQTAMLAVI